MFDFSFNFFYILFYQYTFLSLFSLYTNTKFSIYFIQLFLFLSFTNFHLYFLCYIVNKIIIKLLFFFFKSTTNQVSNRLLSLEYLRIVFLSKLLTLRSLFSFSCLIFFHLISIRKTLISKLTELMLMKNVQSF